MGSNIIHMSDHEMNQRNCWVLTAWFWLTLALQLLWAWIHMLIPAAVSHVSSSCILTLQFGAFSGSVNLSDGGNHRWGWEQAAPENDTWLCPAVLQILWKWGEKSYMYSGRLLNLICLLIQWNPKFMEDFNSIALMTTYFMGS